MLRMYAHNLRLLFKHVNDRLIMYSFVYSHKILHRFALIFAKRQKIGYFSSEKGPWIHFIHYCSRACTLKLFTAVICEYS